MDLLQSYESEESFAEVSTERELKPTQFRSVYLVTYSQAEFKKFPSKEIFAETVPQFFTSTNVKVVQWTCFMEEHKSTGGNHYHMCIKLNRNKRWMPVKQKCLKNMGYGSISPQLTQIIILHGNIQQNLIKVLFKVQNILT